ncbi:hypothetical protein KY290_034305 [Solanum tuberosum]|uniref:Ubiquitin-protein ligase n=1 Tax=Solanum tuberosum TaxID=4113 RepID=A0ABQ7U2V1_SOLTU|nr:hypothetical protein KY284_033399 [Solanum tuberosum]KAH0741262.1 hypothetical protein KY290_034305 [Solanum tuberosum]
MTILEEVFFRLAQLVWRVVIRVDDPGSIPLNAFGVESIDRTYLAISTYILGTGMLQDEMTEHYSPGCSLQAKFATFTERLNPLHAREHFFESLDENLAFTTIVFKSIFFPGARSCIIIFWYLEFQDCLFHPPHGFKGFKKLISLDLLHVTFVPSIFTNIISKSPLLERLRLCSCTNFDTLEIDVGNLKFFEFIGETKSISFKNAPMLEKFFHYMPSLLELNLCGSILENFYDANHSRAEKLQRVHVNLFMGLEMKMKFMKFILASAPVLKEVFIWNFACLIHRSDKQMMDEMKEICRASPNIEFIFE